MLQAQEIKVFKQLESLAEPAFKEFKTTEFIKNYLEKNGITDFKTFDTGLFGTLDFGAKKTIGIRADIDALPTNKENTEFKHLCGHHLHSSALLLTLSKIIKKSDKPKVNIRYIFQPAEEIVQGAPFLIEKGVLENLSEIYGMHVEPELDLGTFSIKKNEVMAGARHFDIEFFGSATHAAYPHLGTDLVVAAADFITKAQSIISRKINPTEKAVISFGKIEGGTVGNILPDKLRIEGTYRFFNEKINKKLVDNLNNLLKSIEIFYSIKTNFVIHDGPPPLINNEKLVDKLYEKLKNIKTKLVDDDRISMGGEDFAFYLLDVPGCFLRLGIKNTPEIIPLHSKNLVVPEKALEYAIDVWENLIYSIE
jgi:amidohydrolase